MATSIGGALKEVVEGGSPLKLYLDSAPANTAPPYLTYNDNVSFTPALKGGGQVMQVTRSMQINMWQKTGEEDLHLVASLLELLDGATLRVDNVVQTFKVIVTNAIRLEEALDAGLVHNEIDIDVKHPISIP